MRPGGAVPPIAWAFSGISINGNELQLNTVADVQTMLEVLQAAPPASFASLPKNGLGQVTANGFWSLQNPYWPPLPSDINALDAWPLGNGSFILDDRNVDYAALQGAEEEQVAQSASASPKMRMSMMMSSLSTAYAYGNPVYLTNMAACFTNDGSITAHFNIAGGTNFVPYDILTSTNLTIPVGNWNWLGIGYTSNNYSFYEQPASLGFYLLAKPSKTMTVGIGNDTVGQCDVPYGLTNALQVAGGGGQSLALKTDGTVVAWGANYYGEGVVPTNLTGVAMISAGYYHDVALLTNGTVKAWGFNNPALGYPLTEVPTGLTNAVVISAQALHTLALLDNGTVVAWGYNTSFGETNVPAGLTNVTAISAGFQFNLVVSNGMVVAWGDNTAGQCNVPPGLTNVVDVEAGTYHSLALRQNGTVVAWGDDLDGETEVPAGLSNVVAIAAGGDPDIDTAYSMALKKDGTLVVWGDDDAVDPFGGLSNVIGMAAGADHALAVRTGPRTPVISQEPENQYQVTNGTVTFAARGAGLYGVTYQWQTNGMNLPGANNATLTVSNVTVAKLGNYEVVVTDNGGMGSITSSNVNITLVTAPAINSETLPTNQLALAGASLTLTAAASAPGQFEGFPLAYQWQFDGTNIAGATSASDTFPATNSGTYSLIVSNAAGSTVVSWQVAVLAPAGISGWGANSNGQLNASTILTNVISLAAGTAHGVAALDGGSVSNWGSYWTGTSLVSAIPPPTLTNALAVAAGSRHDLALLQNGRVAAWGWNDFGQTNVPANATNATAIAAGGQQSLALLQNGTVVQWGLTNAAIPGGLTNVTEIAAGTNFALALLQNSTVVAWGANNLGQTNVPAGLSNVVAIAAGGAHALALEQNGTVIAWGDNTYGETNVPASLTNAMKIAAGDNHSIALENNGTVVAWGDDAFGEANSVTGLNQVKLIAGGDGFTVAAQFSPTVMYPVNVSQDLLLVYNTNSANSAFVLNYYLAHRPVVSRANVLGIGCPGIYITNAASNGNFMGLTNAYDYETVSPPDFTNQVLNPVLTWLAANPTLRPQYVVMMLDVPSRVNTSATNAANYPFYSSGIAGFSVSYQLANSVADWQPFITHINMLTTNDCIAYINKLQYFGSNYSPGNLIISARAGGYGNTNYVLDGIRHGSGYQLTDYNYTAYDYVVSNVISALLLDGVSSNEMFFSDGTETIVTNLTTTNYYNLSHPTGTTNVAGYICWGVHSSLGGGYAVNGAVDWIGNSGWYLIATIESFNGQRYEYGQANFTQWFSTNAFGQNYYASTPAGALSNVDEPGVPGANFSPTYLGLWAAGKNFGICAWTARNTPYFQVVGDPFLIH